MKKFIDLISGITLIVYIIIINILSSRIVAFSGVVVAAGGILIIYHFLKDMINKNPNTKRIIKGIKVLISIGLIIFIALEIAIVAYPKKSKDEANYILVLGAGLNNGNELSLTLKDRLDTTLKCIKEYNKDSYIAVSGGQGGDETVSEASAMKKYLVENGVEEKKIIMEDKSTNTFENFKFSKEKLEEHSNKKVKELKIKVITTDFHALRSRLLAKRNGYGEMVFYSSKTVSYLIPIFYVRESVALVKSVLLDR